MKGASRAALILGAFAGIHLVLCFAWPAWKKTVLTVRNAAIHPWLRKSPSQKPESQNPSSELARYSRSMEFRIRHYPLESSLLKEWNAEWKITPSHEMILLRILLQRLPAVASQKNSLSMENLRERIQALIDEGKAENANNGFFTIAESILLSYSDHGTGVSPKGTSAEETPWSLLKRDGKLEQVDSALGALNRGERSLWRAEQKPWVLFPLPPRIWGYELETPFWGLSREIATQERRALKKYNLELAQDLAMTHLQLSHWVLEGAWTAEDLAISRAMVNRALDPFVTNRDSHPTPAQLEENFSNFLEEHANPILAAKYHSWMADLGNRETIIARCLPEWRRAQQLAYWNVSGVLACLFAQAISLSLAWIVIIFSGNPPEKKKNASPLRFRILLVLLAFSAAPFCWMLTNWPPGGFSLLFSLGGSWVLWYVALTWGCPEGQTPEWRTALSATAIAIFTAATLLTLSVSYVLEWRDHCLEIMLQQGWFTG